MKTKQRVQPEDLIGRVVKFTPKALRKEPHNTSPASRMAVLEVDPNTKRIVAFEYVNEDTSSEFLGKKYEYRKNEIISLDMAFFYDSYYEVTDEKIPNELFVKGSHVKTFSDGNDILKSLQVKYKITVLEG